VKKLLKVFVILELNLVIFNFFFFLIFGDESLKFGYEPINLVMNKIYITLVSKISKYKPQQGETANGSFI
jgi:hypothetical protein